MEWFNAEYICMLYRAFDEPVFLNKLLKNANFLAKKLIKWNNAQLQNNKATIHGLLDDYAFTISAFIELYQAINEKWLYKAKELNDYDNPFYDSKSGCFFIHTIITLIWLSENGSSR
jgi:uncharacterized protein YyaL (SSP411 family)